MFDVRNILGRGLHGIKRSLSLLHELADRLSLLTGYAAGTCIFLLMLLILADVGMRNLIGKSTLLTVELGGYSFVFIVFWGLAYTLRVRGHIRVKLLVSRLSLRTQYSLHLATMLLSIGLIAVGIWLAWATAWRSYEDGVISLGILHTPQYIPQLAMVTGMAFFFMQAASQLFMSKKEFQEKEEEFQG